MPIVPAPRANPCWRPATVGKLLIFDDGVCELMRGGFVIYSRVGWENGFLSFLLKEEESQQYFSWPRS
jgi:hypothetical protein